MTELSFVPDRAAAAGIDGVRLAAIDGAYDDIATKAAQRVREGYIGALYTPIVSMTFDATLNALSQPGIPESLPNEVRMRAIIASDCATRVAKIGAVDEFFLSFLVHNRYTRRLLHPHDISYLNSPDRMSALSTTTFTDPSIVIGGALRLLNRVSKIGQEHEPAPAVIARSTRLLAVANLHSQNASSFWRQTGFPYTLPGRLQLGQDERQRTRVDFTSSTHALISALADISMGGCPAARIPLADARGTVLTESWQRLVDFFVVEGATTTMPNVRKIPLAAQP